jgi:hypothetical protein
MSNFSDAPRGSLDYTSLQGSVVEGMFQINLTVSIRTNHIRVLASAAAQWYWISLRLFKPSSYDSSKLNPALKKAGFDMLIPGKGYIAGLSNTRYSWVWGKTHNSNNSKGRGYHLWDRKAFLSCSFQSDKLTSSMIAHLLWIRLGWGSWAGSFGLVIVV